MNEIVQTTSDAVAAITEVVEEVEMTMVLTEIVRTLKDGIIVVRESKETIIEAAAEAIIEAEEARRRGEEINETKKDIIISRDQVIREGKDRLRRKRRQKRIILQETSWFLSLRRPRPVPNRTDKRMTTYNILTKIA